MKVYTTFRKAPYNAVSVILKDGNGYTTVVMRLKTCVKEFFYCNLIKVV
jgi:hypothetical protein